MTTSIASTIPMDLTSGSMVVMMDPSQKRITRHGALSIVVIVNSETSIS